MPAENKDKRPVAILCGDIHLSHKAPRARRGEPSWYDAMDRPLKCLRVLQRQLRVPVICAGDLFDSWNAPAELINFAINQLPQNFHSIVGQHDLPNHNTDSLFRSAFWSVALANKVNMLGREGDPIVFGQQGYSRDLSVSGFGWKQELKKAPGIDAVRMSVAHHFVWSGKDTAYYGAPQSSNVLPLLRKLKGYDICLFGDNHKQFWTTVGDCRVLNLGSFMRRNIDQEDHTPCMAVLYDDGDVDIQFLPTDKEVFDASKITTPEESEIDLSPFLAEMKSTTGDSVDSSTFINLVRRYVDSKKTTNEVEARLLEILENVE